MGRGYACLDTRTYAKECDMIHLMTNGKIIDSGSYQELIENTESDLKIKLAPPRETLKMFGGFYNIDDFRQSTEVEGKTYNIIKPPMISIIPCIEENINKVSNSIKE